MFHLVIDTEATPVKQTNGVNAKAMRVYDVGVVVADANGREVESYNAVAHEIFSNENLMNNAYYRSKLPFYYENIRNGSLPVKRWADIIADVSRLIERYNIGKVWAFNARFDRDAMDATTNYLSRCYFKRFPIGGAAWFDLAAWAGASICGTRKYARWSIENGLVSDKGTPRTTAEAVYRYITGDSGFIEDHTALSDARIECAILSSCIKRRRKNTGANFGSGWRYAAQAAKMLAKA